MQKFMVDSRDPRNPTLEQLSRALVEDEEVAVRIKFEGSQVTTDLKGHPCMMRREGKTNTFNVELVCQYGGGEKKVSMTYAALEGASMKHHGKGVIER